MKPNFFDVEGDATLLDQAVKLVAYVTQNAFGAAFEKERPDESSAIHAAASHLTEQWRSQLQKAIQSKSLPDVLKHADEFDKAIVLVSWVAGDALTMPSGYPVPDEYKALQAATTNLCNEWRYLSGKINDAARPSAEERGGSRVN